MATKLDKKDLTEPDKLQILFLKIRAFIEEHRMRIYIGAGIFVLILVLAGGWSLYQRNYEKNADKNYTKVFEAARKTVSPEGDTSTIKGYKDLISQYPRSRAAVTSLYRLGNIYFDRREIDAAILAYQDFLNKASADSDLVTLAYNGMGACYELKKDFNKALETYEKAMKSSSAPSFETLNYAGAARVYEAMNNNAKAVEFYRKALGKTTDPLMTLYLKRKISSLS